jgi:hypothetical protein
MDGIYGSAGSAVGYGSGSPPLVNNIIKGLLFTSILQRPRVGLIGRCPCIGPTILMGLVNSLPGVEGWMVERKVGRLPGRASIQLVGCPTGNKDLISGDPCPTIISHSHSFSRPPL